MDEIVYTPQKAAYLRWMEQEGIPIFDGLAVEDVTELPRKPWARVGGTGSYIQLKGSGGVTGMYVVEIPPGGALRGIDQWRRGRRRGDAGVCAGGKKCRPQRDLRSLDD